MSLAVRKTKTMIAVQARAVFLEYHDTDDVARAYAKAKLESGTAPLTPEAVAYMQGMLMLRKEAKYQADKDAANDLAK